MCGRPHLELQERDVEELMKVLQAEAVLHGGLGVAEVGGAQRSARGENEVRPQARSYGLSCPTAPTSSEVPSAGDYLQVAQAPSPYLSLSGSAERSAACAGLVQPPPPTWCQKATSILGPQPRSLVHASPAVPPSLGPPQPHGAQAVPLAQGPDSTHLSRPSMRPRTSSGRTTRCSPMSR